METKKPAGPPVTVQLLGRNFLEVWDVDGHKHRVPLGNISDLLEHGGRVTIYVGNTTIRTAYTLDQLFAAMPANG